MSKSKAYKINTGEVIYEIVDDEVIIINLNTGNYYSLADTGFQIWSSIEKEILEDEILTKLFHMFDGEEKNIRSSLSDFLNDLMNKSIIVEVQGSHHSDEMVVNTKVKSNQAKQPFTPPILQEYTDMQDLLLLDPIHEADDRGWPHVKDE